MKSLSALFIVSSMLFSGASFAVSTLTCKASMTGSSQYAPKGSIAPTLVGYTKAVTQKYADKEITLNFDLATVEKERTYAVLDGRTRLVNLAVKIDVKSTAEGVKVSVENRETRSVVAIKTVRAINGNSVDSVNVKTEFAALDLNCSLK